MATASTLKIESSRLTNPDGDGKSVDADAVDYDNSTSGLSATDAQAAIDEAAVSGVPIQLVLGVNHTITASDWGGAAPKTRPLHIYLTAGATITLPPPEKDIRISVIKDTSGAETVILDPDGEYLQQDSRGTVSTDPLSISASHRWRVDLMASASAWTTGFVPVSSWIAGPSLADASVTPDKIAQYLDVVFTTGRTVQGSDLGKLIIFTGSGTLTMADAGPEYGSTKRPFVLVYGFGDVTISGGGTTDGLTIPEGQMVTLLKYDDTNSWISMSPLS